MFDTLLLLLFLTCYFFHVFMLNPPAYDCLHFEKLSSRPLSFIPPHLHPPSSSFLTYLLTHLYTLAHVD